MLACLVVLVSWIAPLALATSSFPVLTAPGLLTSAAVPRAFALPPVSLPRAPLDIFPVVVSRRQMEMLPGSAPLPTAPELEPTCAELRSMWRHMRRMSRQMELTNEIPKLQDPFTAASIRYHRRPSKYPDPNPYSAAKSSKDKVFHGHFGKIAQPTQFYRANEVMAAPLPNPQPQQLGFHEFDGYVPRRGFEPKTKEPVPGRFADSALPEESLGEYGTVVRTPAERAKVRAQYRPGSVVRDQQFGISNFRPHIDSTGIGRVPFRATKPHSVHQYGTVQSERRGPPEITQAVGQRTKESGRVERIDQIALPWKLNNSCLRLQNKPCNVDLDCKCPKLFCGGNKCRPLSKALKYGRQNWGNSWLVDPSENALVYGPKKELLWPRPF